ALAYQAGLRDAVARAEAEEEEARRQQRLAVEDYQAARETLNRMLGRLQGRRVTEVPQLQELRRDLVEDTRAFYERALRRRDDADPAVRFDTAVAYGTTGVIQINLGRPGPAEEDLRRAVALLEALVAEHPDDLN